MWIAWLVIALMLALTVALVGLSVGVFEDVPARRRDHAR